MMESTEALNWWHVIAFFVTVMLMMYVAESNRSRFMTFIVGLGLILVNGLRHGYIDTRAYRNWFLGVDPSQVLSLDYLLNGTAKDRGFNVLIGAIRLFTDNSQTFLLIMGAITVGCLFFSIVKRTPEKTFAVFLFICTGCFLDTMNGLRQALASALLFALLPEMIFEKKFLKYVITVAVISTIHGSALIFIPLYSIVQSKPWSGATGLVILLSLGLVVGFGYGLGGVVAEALEGTSYGQDYGTMLTTANTSVNTARVFVAAVPVILSFLSRRSKNRDFSMYTVAFNMSLINLVTWIFATKVLYFYRLAMYFQPYMILLLCYELYYMENRNNRKSYKALAVVLFIVWHVISLSVMGNQFFVGYLKY